MDKQKLMEEMAQEIADICPDMVENGCEQKCYTCLSVGLLNRGYGNIEQALTEFAERLKENCTTNIYYRVVGEPVISEILYKEQIDRILKEFLHNDE